MLVNRRDFTKWLGLITTGLAIPNVAVIASQNEKKVFITEVDYNLSYELNPVFECGQIAHFMKMWDETRPLVSLTIKYSDGSIKNFESNSIKNELGNGKPKNMITNLLEYTRLTNQSTSTKYYAELSEDERNFMLIGEFEGISNKKEFYIIKIENLIRR